MRFLVPRVIEACFLFVLLGPIEARGEDDLLAKLHGSDWYGDCLKAWRAREKATETLRIEWTETRTIKKGAETGRLPGFENEVFPSEDQTVTCNYLLTLKRDKVFFRSLDFDIAKEKDTAIRRIPREFQSAYDGREPRTYFPIRQGAKGIPQGTIIAGDRFDEYNVTTVFPALINVRAANEKFLLSEMTRFRPLREPVEVRGASCRVLEVKGDTWVRRYLVNPAAAFRIERFEDLYLNGKTIYNIDFFYTNQQMANFSLIGWTTTFFRGHSEFVENTRAVVDRYEVNSSIDDAIFTLKFPPGTYVNDQRSGREFIIRSDGQERTVLPRERRYSHDELMNSETGKVPKTRARFSFVSTFAVILFANGLLAAISVLLYRRFRGTA